MLKAVIKPIYSSKTLSFILYRDQFRLRHQVYKFVRILVLFGMIKYLIVKCLLIEIFLLKINAKRLKIAAKDQFQVESRTLVFIV